MLREPPLTLFGEHELAVHEHVELRLRTLDDLGSGVGARVDLGRETRGPAVVTASDGAVVDLDAHARNLPGGRSGTPERPAHTRLV